MSASRLRSAIVALLLMPASARAQDAPQQIPAGAPEEKASDRPGLIRLGPVYVTPKLRIGPIGLDTNTLWIPSHQPIDFRAVGGPGLEIVVPMGPARLVVDGGVSYTYYLKNETQRRWGGDGRARLDWSRGKLDAAAEESFRRDFVRPSFEVDRRIVQDQWRTTVGLAIARRSRLGLFVDLSSRRFDVPDHQEFAGTDLTRTLSRSEYKATLVPKLRLTPKTSLVVGADYEVDEFKFETTRDADSNRIFGGFEIESPTRLDGRIVGGVRLFRLKGRAEQAATLTTGYADADLWYHFGPRTRVEARYLRDLSYSAFTVQAETPTLTTEMVRTQLDKDLWSRFNLRVFGSYGRLRTAGAITVRRDSGETITQRRRDIIREGGADFGYKFRGSLRIGVAAIYTSRGSTFDDFGIKGLLVGGTITVGGLSYSGNFPR
jgi:hypothetical protein